MSANTLSGIEKAALLLKSLSPAIVEKVLARLDPRQSKLLKTELDKVAARPDVEQSMTNILNEAVEALGSPGASTVAPNGKSAPAPGGKSGTPTPADASREKASAIAPPLQEPDPSDPIAAIAAIPPETLTMALDTENSRTISLLMNRLDVEVAGQIYKRLSSAKRKEVSLRFTESTVVS